MKKHLVLGLALISAPLWAQQEAKQFSLQEAQDYAARNSYTVQDKVLDYEKARKTIKETAAMGLPQISGSFGYSYNAQVPKQPIPAQFFNPNAGEDDIAYVAFGVAHQNQAQLQLSQLLIDGSYFVALQATRVVKETKALEREEAEINARRNTAQSYYGALVAEETLEILKANLETVKSNFDETQKLFENGFVEDQDVSQMELLYNNLQNNVNNAERQVKLAYQLLKFNMGISLEEEITLSSSLEEVINPVRSDATLAQNPFQVDKHISFRNLLSQEKGASLQLANERAKYFPTLSGFVTHSQSNFSNQASDAFSFDTYWIPGTTIGASLSWNIFTGLGRTARVQKAKIDLERIRLAKTATESQLELQFHQAQSDYDFALDNLSNQMRNRTLSEKVRDRTLRKYKEGLASSLELTQAENQYLEAERNYINAILNVLNAKEALEYALGQ
ncbi:TolC family protein [Croceimicrobium sp.]|uniref:TolC family protein n=1 Tax=Croceimicrobium sp. TaxID=2828340 RepID=UPI003BACE42C